MCRAGPPTIAGRWPRPVELVRTTLTIPLPVLEHPRFLLLQVRNPDDPMREHEVSCFQRAFGTANGQIRVFDLLSGAPSEEDFDSVDVVLLGGSGDYSVARGGPWLAEALAAMVRVYESSKPTFASC